MFIYNRWSGYNALRVSREKRLDSRKENKRKENQFFIMIENWHKMTWLSNSMKQTSVIHQSRLRLLLRVVFTLLHVSEVCWLWLWRATLGQPILRRFGSHLPQESAVRWCSCTCCLKQGGPPTTRPNAGAHGDYDAVYPCPYAQHMTVSHSAPTPLQKAVRQIMTETLQPIDIQPLQFSTSPPY